MAKFRAIEKGYYGDIIHDPETGRHVIFDAPDDFQCSWAERVDGEVAAEAVAEVSEETVAAEAILDTEAAVGIPDVADDDVPAETEEDVNAATGVETL